LNGVLLIEKPKENRRRWPTKDETETSAEDSGIKDLRFPSSSVRAAEKTKVGEMMTNFVSGSCKLVSIPYKPR